MNTYHNDDGWFSANDEGGSTDYYPSKRKLLDAIASGEALFDGAPKNEQGEFDRAIARACEARRVKRRAASRVAVAAVAQRELF